MTSKLESPNEERPPLWKVWLVAARPHTLTASLSPCIVGYSIAVTLLQEAPYSSMASATSTSSTSSSSFVLHISLSWFFFCVLIQLATNLHNDYADFVRGADTKERVGPARATQRGWLTPSQTAGASTICLLVALAIGIHLLSTDLWFWFILGSSCFNAVAYTGGPFPLGYIGLGQVSIAYSGLGDIFCFLYFGLVAVLSIPYVALRLLGNQEPLLVLFFQVLRPTYALPAALLSTAIIVVNNLRDRHTDVLANKRTLAVRFGSVFCKLEYTGLLVTSYGMALYQMYTMSSWYALLPFLTIPFAFHCNKAMWTLTGAELNPFVGKTALLELQYCALQSLSIFLSQ